jgi:hypothetical protein
VAHPIEQELEFKGHTLSGAAPRIVTRMGRDEFFGRTQIASAEEGREAREKLGSAAVSGSERR